LVKAFAIIPVPSAEANGNEEIKFIAVPFMGRIDQKQINGFSQTIK
jgi:hypothetical protein